MGRGRSDETKVIVAKAYEILESENPMTLRQLFYRLVSVRALENLQADYQRLSRIMTDAREREEIPFEWMVDRSRPVYETNAFTNPAAYAETVKRAYRRDYWQDQPWHVEVWAEKDAILGSIQPVTDEYGITVRVGRGFLSTTRVHEIAERFRGIEKPIQVFYLGDHDPSGICIERDAARRVREQMLPAEVADLEFEMFKIERLAIHPEDIGDFDLPPLRIKTSDSRAKEFTRQHGSECVELDALPPSELRDRLTNAIQERIDRPRWDRAVIVEAAERESIIKIAGKIGKVFAAGVP